MKWRKEQPPPPPPSAGVPLLTGPPPLFSSVGPSHVSQQHISQELLIEGFKGIEQAIYDSAAHISTVISHFELHRAEVSSTVENMVKTLYCCHIIFIEAFEEMLFVSVEHPDALAKRVAARKALKEAKKKMREDILKGEGTSGLPKKKKRTRRQMKRTSLPKRPRKQLQLSR